jgi:hypothetical protein
MIQSVLLLVVSLVISFALFSQQHLCLNLSNGCAGVPLCYVHICLVVLQTVGARRKISSNLYPFSPVFFFCFFPSPAAASLSC